MTLLRFPGFIDPHVHMREPGDIQKENWASGTAAALAGGFTLVCAMPNTQPSITDGATLEIAENAAAAGARCDYALYLGATQENVQNAAALAPRCAGLKMYLDQTFGTLRMDRLDALVAHCANWPAASPLVCHAEGRTVAAAILAAHLAGRSIHICHVSRREEIELIRAAREQGMQVTCEVAPHHLWLCAERDAARLGAGWCEVRPRLQTADDGAALRENLDVIDCFATDHAPHTRAEKGGENPPPGYPGLETALPLYLRLLHEGLLGENELADKLTHNARRIFNLPEQPETWAEVDPDAVWTPRAEALHTRAGWSPWEGEPLRGQVRRVVLRGQEVYVDGQVKAPPGYGVDIRTLKRAKPKLEAIPI